MKKTLAIIFSLCCTACSQKSGEQSATPAITETDIKSAWTELTEQEGKWVIFEPCAADVFNIQWEADTLIIDWGQEASKDKINRIASANNSFVLEGVDQYSDPPNHTFRIEPLDSVQGVARWWIMNETSPRLLVLNTFKDKYPVVKESCDGMFDEPEKK